MTSRLGALLLCLCLLGLLHGSGSAESEEVTERVRTAPQRNLEATVIDGGGKEVGGHDSKDNLHGIDERNIGKSRVSVSTVAWLTLAMAAATGLGAVPFFFLELEPQWAGVCNGLAAGVMLAASFDLVQEGQSYGGGGNCVVVGIMSGAIFIWLCKQVQNACLLHRFNFLKLLP